MRNPLWPRFLFALLLVLSIGTKVIAGNQSLRGAERELHSSTLIMGKVSAFFEREGFHVGAIGGELDLQFMPANAGDCNLVALNLAPHGWHSASTRQMASPGDQVFFLFDATVYQEQPKWRPWFHNYWQLLNYYVGRRVPTRPVLGFVASPACDLLGMPWQELF